LDPRRGTPFGTTPFTCLSKEKQNLVRKMNKADRLAVVMERWDAGAQSQKWRDAAASQSFSNDDVAEAISRAHADQICPVKGPRTGFDAEGVWRGDDGLEVADMPPMALVLNAIDDRDRVWGVDASSPPGMGVTAVELRATLQLRVTVETVEAMLQACVSTQHLFNRWVNDEWVFNKNERLPTPEELQDEDAVYVLDGLRRLNECKREIKGRAPGKGSIGYVRAPLPEIVEAMSSKEGWGSDEPGSDRKLRMALDLLASAGLMVIDDVEGEDYFWATSMATGADTADLVRVRQDDYKSLKAARAADKYEAYLDEKYKSSSDESTDEDLVQDLDGILDGFCAPKLGPDDNVLGELSVEMRAKIKAMNAEERRAAIVCAFTSADLEEDAEFSDEDVAVALKASDTYAKAAAAAAADL
jgi:hypothetical protein